MKKPLTIVVGGYIVGYPLGGMTWHHLNYLLGLHELGHEVYFLEDSGSFSLPYNPTTWTSEIDSTYGRGYLERSFDAVGLSKRYCYYSEFEDRHYGMTQDELHALLERADLLLCVSGVTPLRPERPRTRRVAIVDTDPVFTQLRMRHDEKFVSYYRAVDAVATFGRLVGTSTSPLPTQGFKWIPTNQPIALRHWPMLPAHGEAMTTIGKWEYGADRTIEFEGRQYRSSKGIEWLKMVDLPRQVKMPLWLGMAGLPKDIAERFAAAGWVVSDPQEASLSIESYRRFIQQSAGEFTVAKQIYAGLPSGWFSDRSAAYLASGRPVVTQHSGFDQWLPTGEGLFSYQTAAEAAEAIETIRRDYPRHAQAARRIATEYFEAGKVLTELLDAVL